MECLKCGRTSKDGQVFCAECLQKMDAYPVKPDVHVVLPKRKTTTQSRKSGKKRRITTPEEQLSVLKKRQRRLIAAVVILALLLCLANLVLVHQWIGGLRNGDPNPTDTTYATHN